MSIPQHHLYPSALFASETPHHVHTVLGSCVAVCLWDPVREIGGINHYMLPLWNGTGLATPRYGNIAIVKLIEQLESLGCKKSHMEAKVFGGAVVLSISNDSSFSKIGERNIEIADSTLQELGIPVVARRVGGHGGYKLIYKTYNGGVLLKNITKTEKPTPAAQPIQ
jgi:chemotaxis protein CheD